MDLRYRFNRQTGNWEYLAFRGAAHELAPNEAWFCMEAPYEQEFDRITLLRPAAPVAPSAPRTLLRALGG
jgi:hypothetical protein